MPNTIGATAVPSFQNVEELSAALKCKDAFEPADLYPRDGTSLQAETEARVAELARTPEGTLLLTSSGMSAVVGAVEAVVNNGSTVAIANQLYSQSVRYLGHNLPERGNKVVRFDSACNASIERVIERHRPDVIVAETVANGPDVPVLDVEHLLKVVDQSESEATVILDNTLPLSTCLNIGQIASGRRVIAVESGTKSYTFNRELLGLVYTENEELLATLQQQRRTRGFGPNLAGVERIAGLLPESPRQFDERNSRIFAHAGYLARVLYEAQWEASAGFVTSHPAVEVSPNARLDHAVSPVLYLQCIGELDQFELTQKLWSNPNVREHADLGQSFGFDRTRILPDSSFPSVRIAAGAETDVEELGAALQEAVKA